MKSLKINLFFAVLVAIFAVFLVTGVASANHAWGKYHWDKSTDDTLAYPLELVDNLNTAEWDNSLAIASLDWNVSVLKNKVVAGASNSNCDPTNGRVEVCNDEYGTNGWLGIASIWATRGKSNHITQGVVKVNDTYFNMAQYDSQAWRDFVMCQEVGHELGLDHQDENSNNANFGTCMDYTNDPDGTVLGQLDNRHPNQHDYNQMTEMYAHLNSTDGGGSEPGNGGGKGKKPKKVGADIDFDDPSSWGRAVGQDASGNDSVFEKDLGNGQVVITHVIWVQ
jgi:hypothetical protein